MSRYSVPALGLTLEVEPHYPPGFLRVRPDRRSKRPARSSLSVWTKPIARVGLLPLTTVHRGFVVLLVSSCARWDSQSGFE